MAAENTQVEAAKPDTAIPTDATTTVPETTQTETVKEEGSMDVDVKEEPTDFQAENVKEELKEEVKDEPMEESKDGLASESVAIKEEPAGNKPNTTEANGKNILKTSGVSHGNYRKNIKFDPMSKAVTDDASEIRAQV